jgi:hypothetical protein
LAKNWGKSEAEKIRAFQWQAALQRGLAALGRSATETSSVPKSASWKIALAAWMKIHTQATNRWLSQSLSLGAETALSRNLANYRLRLQADDPDWKRLMSASSS